MAKFTPRRFQNSAYGTKFVLTFGVGALSVKLVGAIKAYSRIDNVFPVIGMIAIMLVAGIGVLVYTARKASNRG